MEWKNCLRHSESTKLKILVSLFFCFVRFSLFFHPSHNNKVILSTKIECVYVFCTMFLLIKCTRSEFFSALSHPFLFTSIPLTNTLLYRFFLSFLFCYCFVLCVSVFVSFKNKDVFHLWLFNFPYFAHAHVSFLSYIFCERFYFILVDFLRCNFHFYEKQLISKMRFNF